MCFTTVGELMRSSRSDLRRKGIGAIEWGAARERLSVWKKHQSRMEVELLSHKCGQARLILFSQREKGAKGKRPEENCAKSRKVAESLGVVRKKKGGQHDEE